VVWSTIFATGVAAVGDDVYYCERGTNSVKKLSGATGLISTVAGNGTKGFSGDGGPAGNAMLSSCFDVAVSLLGEVFIADYGNNRIRKIFTNGNITTIAGNGTIGYGGDGGLATKATFKNPTGVAVSSTGEVFIADYGNGCVRKIFKNGTIVTIAGTGTYGYNGDGGLAIYAKLNGPRTMKVSSSGEVYIADGFSNRIRKIFTNGTITTVVGSGTGGYGGDGGLAVDAQLTYPSGVCISNKGEIFVADSLNGRVRKVFDAPLCYNKASFYACGGSERGVCASTNNCSCLLGYFGKECEFTTCNGVMNNVTSVCLGRGNCVMYDTCSCNVGYYGWQCENVKCNGILSNSSQVCLSRGNCTATDKCECQVNYYGSDCEYFNCFGLRNDNSSVCSGHGICTSPNVCQCNSTHTGQSCEIPICFNKAANESNTCNGKGSCVGPNQCNCNVNYFGLECQFTTCYGVQSTNVSVCSAHGSCISKDNCICQDGYYGLSCDGFNSTSVVVQSDDTTTIIVATVIPVAVVFLFVVLVASLLTVFAVRRYKSGMNMKEKTDIELKFEN